MAVADDPWTRPTRWLAIMECIVTLIMVVLFTLACRNIGVNKYTRRENVVGNVDMALPPEQQRPQPKPEFELVDILVILFYVFSVLEFIMGLVLLTTTFEISLRSQCYLTEIWVWVAYLFFFELIAEIVLMALYFKVIYWTIPCIKLFLRSFMTNGACLWAWGIKVQYNRARGTANPTENGPNSINTTGIPLSTDPFTSVDC